MIFLIGEEFARRQNVMICDCCVVVVIQALPLTSGLLGIGGGISELWCFKVKSPIDDILMISCPVKKESVDIGDSIRIFAGTHKVLNRNINSI